MDNFIVYIHHNLINHKVYVGITCQKPEKRWGEGKHYEHNKHFSSAINKYGWQNFDHIIVGTCLSKESACEIEKDLIALYKSNEYEHGYNSSSGGELSAYKHGRSKEKEYLKEIINSPEYKELSHLRDQARERFDIYKHYNISICKEYDSIKNNKSLLKTFIEEHPIITSCFVCGAIFEINKGQSNHKIYCPVCTQKQKERNIKSKQLYDRLKKAEEKIERMDHKTEYECQETETFLPLFQWYYTFKRK